MPVSMVTATLGGNIEVPTLGGKAEIELPEGTQHGKTFRLRGKGIKGVRSSYPGDLYCHIAIETPVKLTEHQKKLLKELDESLKKGRRAPLTQCQELGRTGSRTCSSKQASTHSAAAPARTPRLFYGHTLRVTRSLPASEVTRCTESAY